MGLMLFTLGDPRTPQTREFRRHFSRCLYQSISSADDEDDNSTVLVRSPKETGILLYRQNHT